MLKTGASYTHIFVEKKYRYIQNIDEQILVHVWNEITI